MGGAAGGKARAKSLSAAARKKIASDAAKARWGAKEKTPKANPLIKIRARGVELDKRLSD